MPTLSHEQILQIIESEASVTADSGIGLYRHHYQKYGGGFWGWEPGSLIKWFSKFKREEILNAHVLDLGAGNGRNSFELYRLGASKVMAVEVDTVAASICIDALHKLENSGAYEEGNVAIYKNNALDFVKDTKSKFDIVIAYGLFHVFKDGRVLEEALLCTAKCVDEQGWLILQFITDKYPAPKFQPELEGVICTKEKVLQILGDGWEVRFLDETDIIHSHEGSSDDHKHGSCRLVLQKK